MKNKIPTAEEFLDFDIPNQADYETAIKSAKEFAAIHVEAALKAAYKKHTLEYIHQNPTGGDAQKVNKDSILTAYPKELIV